MRWVLSPLLASFFFWMIGLADDPPKPPSVKDEFQHFQGTWQVTAWEENGKVIADDEKKARDVYFGGNIFIFHRKGKVHQAGTIQIDPSKTPRTMNLSVKEGDGADGVMLGIYSFDKEILKLCFDPTGQMRPNSLNPEAKSGYSVITLKKAKPLVEEQVEIVGKYESKLIEANGKVVTTDVTIERRGDAYQATYTRDEKVLFIGTALRKGDQLSMCWVSSGQIGVSVYKIEKGPKLLGEYTVLGGIGLTGKEVLTPWQKID
jgi:uncharacterized protein (TIGR03067 family)